MCARCEQMKVHHRMSARYDKNEKFTTICSQAIICYKVMKIHQGMLACYHEAMRIQKECPCVTIEQWTSTTECPRSIGKRKLSAECPTKNQQRKHLKKHPKQTPKKWLILRAPYDTPKHAFLIPGCPTAHSWNITIPQTHGTHVVINTKQGRCTMERLRANVKILKLTMECLLATITQRKFVTECA